MSITKYRIKPKQDFGRGRGFYINGEYVKHGFVVTDGFCNIMPGATWFRTIPDAMRGLRIYLECNGNPALFWERLRS